MLIIVEKIDIKNVEVLFETEGSKLTLKSHKVQQNADGTKTIIIILEGTQTEYSMNPISFQQLRKLISSVDKDKICKYNISINYLLCNGEFYRIKQQSSDFSEAIKNSSILNNIFSDMKSTQERFDKYIMSYQ